MNLINAAEPSAGSPRSPVSSCRFCGSPLSTTFVDLGVSPLCQTHIAPDRLRDAEQFYPLHAYVCTNCFLVQLEEFVAPSDIFSEYAYLSSYSDSWVEHARRYTETMREKFALTQDSFIVEIASNDGYLLRHFVAQGMRVLGVEPAANVAEIARRAGVATVTEFFGRQTARSLKTSHGTPDLIALNNVLAHVPDINDFVAGLSELAGEQTVITAEFPHLLQLLDHNQFDTIYHEHFSYLSFSVVQRIFESHQLNIFDVEELPTHGGSLRVYARKAGAHGEQSWRVAELQSRERTRGLLDISTYSAFQENVKATKRQLLAFLIEAKERGKRICGYGAPGKGNTLLNYCGIRTDFLDFTVDRNPLKQGKFTPGSRIPILPTEAIREHRPDLILILPWNLRDEIVGSLGYAREWGCRFVVPIPRVQVID